MGGSFNPVHIGHIMLADYLAQFTELDMVWLMLSPLNPIKSNPEELINDNARIDMLNIAVGTNPRLSVCDIELNMPRPSYTINSLRQLQETNPDCRFSLVIGGDNWLLFDQWREHDAILQRYSPIVYPRPGYTIDKNNIPPEVTLVDAPVTDISSSFIRRAIAERKDMTNFLPHGVYQYIKTNNLYSHAK